MKKPRPKVARTRSFSRGWMAISRTAIVGILVSISVGILWGTFNGILISKAKVPPLIVTLGSLPWVSLFLAATFGCYGLVRKQVPVDALSGLWVETLAMLPVCGLWALWQAQHGHMVFAAHDASTATLLVGAGIITALPLMAFAAATQRLDLATVGMLMYINPTLQFLTAVWLFDEPLQPARLASFGMIWIGLLVFSWSMWEKVRDRR